MKRKFKVQIKQDVYRYAWEKYKNVCTMAELAKILKVPLPSFFRAIHQEIKVEEKDNSSQDDQQINENKIAVS
jgi:hypothetical protein